MKSSFQKILKEHHDEVFLYTKFGIIRVANSELRGVSGTPEYVRQSCENSLKRLGVDCIDLYYQHRKFSIEHLERSIYLNFFFNEFC